MNILREENNQWESRKNGRRLEVSRSFLVAQSAGRRVDRKLDGRRWRKIRRPGTTEDDPKWRKERHGA